MNLFRSEEHVQRWPLHFQAADDYMMPVGDWAEVFSSPMFRNRLDDDYLTRSPQYLEDYHGALRDKGQALPSPERLLLTVMFTDIVDSTRHATRLGDRAWRSLLEQHDATSRGQIEHYRGSAVKQTGDGFLSSFPTPTGAIRAGVAISRGAVDLGVQVRVGIHLGECEVVGTDLAGVAVHIAARVAATAAPGMVFVTDPVVIAVTGSELRFADQGVHELKGLPGSWPLQSVQLV